MKKVNVFGLNVPVKRVDRVGEDDDLGEYKDGEILISNKVSKKDFMTVLLHECFHAVSHRLGYRQAIDSGEEEIIADSFATFLVENFDIKAKRVK